MSFSNSEISFLVDTMIVETLLSDDGGLRKTAQAGGVLSSLVSKVQGYVGNHIRPDDKVGSLIDMLGPGAIAMTLRAFGLGWMGWLVGLAMSVFHINITDIVGSIWGKLKGLIGGDKQTTSAQVDNIVSSAVQEHDKPMTQEEAEAAKRELDKQQPGDSGKAALQQLRDARLLKLALIQYKYDQENFVKKGQSGLLGMLSGRKAATTNLLSKILGWVFKIALASAGLMVAGDVANKMLGRSNALDNTMQQGRPTDKPEASPQAPPQTVPKQTKFKVKAGYVDQRKTDWVESIPNDPSSIENLLVMYAQQVYDGLDGKEAYIRNAAGLQAIKDRIVVYNRASAGDNFVFIPKYLTSKKQIVDLFIDDVAESVPEGPKTPQ